MVDNSTISLISGADDSNHVGQNKKGEVIVVAFSTLKEDGLVIHQPYRRDISEAEKWLEKPERDYIFTLLTYGPESPEFSVLSRPHNLVIVAPILVKEHLNRHRDLKLDSLKIFLDGAMKANHRQYIRNSFPEFTSCVVDNFNKKQRTDQNKLCKKIECPKIVKMADTISNMLFGNISLDDLFHSEKYSSHYAPVSIEQVAVGYRLVEKLQQ
ncbi:hypothetical protein J4217_01235 [Candidatus Pacearchaeota archaeon]|nr:hypothetical protein [Candidatus Pacearchaeota archaeon]